MGKNTNIRLTSYPIGSMYAIHGNIYHQYPQMLAYIPYMDPMGIISQHAKSEGSKPQCFHMFPNRFAGLQNHGTVASCAMSAATKLLKLRCAKTPQRRRSQSPAGPALAA